MRKYDVLAIGELNADLILTGLQSMPLPGREILADGMSLVLGSSTAICASGMARLGLKTGFIGKIGDDVYGQIVLSSLTKSGIDLSHIQVDGTVPTGLTISLSNRQDRALVTYPGSIASLKAEDVNLRLFCETRHIHVGSYFLQTALRPGLADLFKKAHESGATTSLDAGWDDTDNWNYGIRDVLANTDVFLPNDAEAAHITGKNSVEEAAELLSAYCGTVAIKMGSKGAYIQRGKEILTKPPYEVTPVDTTGAGDSFNAGFLYGFIKGFNLEKCLDYGNACGSVSITRVGGATSCASLEEVKKLIGEA